VIQVVKVQDKYFIKPNINSTDEVMAFLVTNDLGQPALPGETPKARTP